ncbi:hypothetical protein [Thorsellia kenyensis]|uniref:Uncharacterized protein n=1 Tax=Thorsellia kenyensis TaxID=1549888 RepID=A0ABV6C7R7_9GAMM
MKIIGVIFFFIGFITIVLGVLNFELAVYSAVGSTLAICGTLMAIFCPRLSDKVCGSCKSKVHVDAKKCKHCSQDLFN